MRTAAWGIAWCIVMAHPALVGAQDVQAADADADADAEIPDEGRDDQARALFQAGRVAFDNGRYEEALRYFTDSYELSQRPAILYNLGNTAQLLGEDPEAIAFYERYLTEMPDAPNRTAVESRLRMLRERVDNTETQQPPPPDDTIEDSSADVEPQPEPQADTTATGGGTPVGGWILFGGGLAVAVGGVLSLVLAGGGASTVTDAPEGTPWTDVSGDYDAAGTLSIVGGLLLGVGAAAAAAGLTWVLVGGSSETEVAILPGGVMLRGAL